MANEMDNIEQTLPATESVGSETADAPVADAAGEVAATPSRKESYMKGFKEKHPDWKDDDEEGFYGTLADEDAAREEEMNGYRSREEELSTALSGSPLNAALFMDAANGTPIPLSILKRYPNEVKAWMEDPANSDEIEKVFQAQADQLNNNKKLEEESQKNLEESNALIDEMIAAGEIKDETEANELVKFLGDICVGLVANHLEKDWLLAAKKALNYEGDVEAAKAQGEIDGRNQKIVAQKTASMKGGNTHAGLGSSNAGQRLGAKDTAKVTGNTGKRDMWAGMKTNKLN